MFTIHTPVRLSVCTPDTVMDNSLSVRTPDTSVFSNSDSLKEMFHKETINILLCHQSWQLHYGFTEQCDFITLLKIKMHVNLSKKYRLIWCFNKLRFSFIFYVCFSVYFLHDKIPSLRQNLWTYFVNRSNSSCFNTFQLSYSVCKQVYLHEELMIYIHIDINL